MISLQAFLVSFLTITSHLCQREGDATPTLHEDRDAIINFHDTLSSLAPAGIHETKNEVGELESAGTPMTFEDCEPVIKSKDLEPRAAINPDVVNYAEHYRGFLLGFLREVWRAKGPYTVPEDAAKVDGKGLYFFFWSAYQNADDINKQDEIYPLYVGITGRSFEERFKEHIHHGVVHRIRSGQWPTGSGIVNLKIVAYVLNMPLPVAKFFESMFLYAFDFAMNVEENNGERPRLEVLTKPHSVEEGWRYFKEVYDPFKSYLTEFGNAITKGVGN